MRQEKEETEPCVECDRLVYWNESIQDYVHADKPEIGCGLHRGVMKIAEPYEAVKCEDCDCWIYIGKDKKDLRAVEHMEKNHKEILEQHEIGRPYMFYNSVSVEAI